MAKQEAFIYVVSGPNEKKTSRFRRPYRVQFHCITKLSVTKPLSFKSLLAPWLYSALIWGALFIMLGCQMARGFSLALSDALWFCGPKWLIWTLVSPLIFQLVSLFPIERDRWKISLPVEILAAAALILGISWLEQRLGPGAAPQPPPPGDAPPFDQGPPPPPFFIGPAFPAYFTLLSIAHAFYFYRRARQRELRAIELAAGLSEARLQLLRSQLQPHFLFNSLNALGALIQKDPDTAEQMLDSLASFLRLTLEDSHEQKVPLRRELEYVERYLAIEKIRFGRRLSYTIKAADATAGALVPAFILQPLVENSVRHGIEPRAEDGHIAIHAYAAKGFLYVVVHDDGAGLSPSVSEGIGLANVRSRLREYYGELFAFTLTSDSGTWAEIKIPLTAE